MNIRCDRNELKAALDTAKRAMATRSTVPALEGVHLSTDGNTVRLTCTDNTLTISSLMAAEVSEEGEVVMPGRLFSDIIARFPDGELTLKVDEKYTAQIISGGSRTKLQGIDPAEFPELPPIELGADSIDLPQSMLKSMIRQSIFAVATEDTRPILTGALMDVNHYEFSMVALDGFRLAIRQENLRQDCGTCSVVVPGRSLSEIAQTLEDTDTVISLVVDQNYLLIDLGYARMITRLLSGEYIKYKQLLPAARQTRVRIDVSALGEAIRRASLIAREGKNNLVRFAIRQNEMQVTSNSELGDVLEQIAIELEGNELDIAFNARYIEDVIKSLECEQIFIDCTNNFSQCVIRPTEGDAFLYLVLPVRIFA